MRFGGDQPGVLLGLASMLEPKELPTKRTWKETVGRRSWATSLSYSCSRATRRRAVAFRKLRSASSMPGIGGSLHTRRLRRSWEPTLKAQIKRLADLDVIPGDFATHLYKLYSAEGWTKEEPFDRQWAPGEPRCFGMHSA